ncbi:hypothetical protein DJ010_14955 [Nocardioides silvaticus]|uniref:DUF222 domain-containing protein n=2 Tax=Nocardioides silvaticus TaxID=2201891 RepID=A0A316TQ61_9ACTN|nr:DUF222 domain-containing protein [Nocardioides silvaticus]PWN01856.1 hypothetical protein DJ010_14955 [Nocardioides silvaticus]
MTSPGALETATAVLDHARELAEVPWDQLTGAEAVQAAAALAQVKALVDGALVGLAEQLESTGAPEAIGWASTKDFLTHLLGGRKGTGGTLTRVAKKTSRLPAVRAALAAGQISLAQAAVIGGRVSTLPQAPELREDAASKMLGLVAEHGYDATDLDHAFPTVVRELDPDGTLLSADLDKDRAERGAHHARYLSFTPDTLGGVRIKGYATIEETELVKAVLLPLSAPVTTEPGACGGEPRKPEQGFELDDNGHLLGKRCPDPECAHTGADPREHGTRMWDALLEACRRLQHTDSVPHAHSTTARITITIPLANLLEQTDGHLADGGILPTGDRLSAAAVRRLACDAEIIPAVLGSQGQVLDVDRTQRLVTTGIWNALVLRDHHCAFPGCTRLPLACDAHHITHWAEPLRV